MVLSPADKTKQDNANEGGRRNAISSHFTGWAGEGRARLRGEVRGEERGARGDERGTANYIHNPHTTSFFCR